MGSLCSNDSDSCENITSKVCFSSLLQLHFIALIPSCSNSFRQFKIVDEFFSRGLNSKGLYQTSGKKETESRCLVFTVSSSKREIRHQVIGCAATTKKCIKKRDARVELFFCLQKSVNCCLTLSFTVVVLVS